MIQTCTKQATFMALSHACYSFMQWEVSSVHILAAPDYTCSKGPHTFFASAFPHVVKCRYKPFEC